jgi:CubicO group peptidase (beta-lactamase class C family)
LAQDGDLSLNTILSGQASGLVPNQLFMPGQDSSPAKADFIGTLSIKEKEISTEPAEFKSREILGKDPKIFPGAKLSFFSVDGYLVPVSQDVLRYGATPEGKSFWDIIVQPGRIWSQEGDEGWNRAAFPFSLVHSIEGETHNGVALFLYKDGQISGIRFQVVQQTAPYYVEDYFTAWGSLEADYDPTPPGEPEGLEQLSLTFKEANAAVIPLLPWSELEAKVGAEKLEGFDSSINPTEVVFDGLYFEDKLYFKTLSTPAGPLPYPDWQRFGVWSATKTLANGTSLLHLAQKYGPGIMDEKLTDYVPELKGIEGWDEVTFGNCLSMTTAMGTGTDAVAPNDINDGNIDEFYPNWYEAPTVAAKIAAQAQDTHRHPWKPGEHARYRDFDQFILGVAMDRYVKAQEGPQADIWTLMLKEVYEPIGVYYTPINRTLELKGPGQPLMCYGYYPTISDMVRIAGLFQNDGKIGDQQLLNSELLADLKISAKKRGLPTSNEHQSYYHKTFWQGEHKNAQGEVLYFPLMMGWGGNWVILYPDNIVGLRVAKNWDGAPPSRDMSTLNQVAFGLAGQ